MKVLSIRSYFAYPVCLGIKDIENRSWKTDYRGKLLIHSSGHDMEELELDVFPKKWLKDFKAGKTDLYQRELDNFYEKLYTYYGTKDYKNFMKAGKRPFLKSQAIIGQVDLVDIVKNHESQWADKGDWNWVFKNAELFKLPIMFVKGKLKLWNYNFK